ncbi:hypothetical protein JHS3_13270 [Jeongeupia sp. HS-3]|uniref:hypothetical protein n=1 Tax=Jeongeupia sp. HS-3 TaxID=1009682 RepID=UPI0018A4208D|nr:hypothetical protein [Jeongeupia sp. HS-3]BCL75591.1 hypothetical protein JHS3_13270 [Jeongeupia sp. HS-3]
MTGNSKLTSDPALTGSWVLKSARYTSADGTVQEFDAAKLRSIKLISGAHFSYITHLEDGSFYAAGAGTWRAEGGKYQELLTHTSTAAMLGRSYAFRYRVGEDYWHIDGDEDGMQIEEIWQRA